MGVEIKLSDRELPVSPIFIDFLHHIVADIPFEGAIWGDQLSEALSNEQTRLVQSASTHAGTVLAAPVGQRAIDVGRVVVVGQHRRPLRRRRPHPLHHPALLIDRDQERQVGRRRGGCGWHHSRRWSRARGR